MTVTITIPDDLVSPRTGCISQGPKFVGWAQINSARWISVWCRESEIARVGSRSGAGRSKFGAFNFDPMTGDRGSVSTLVEKWKTRHQPALRRKPNKPPGRAALEDDAMDNDNKK